MLYLNRLNNGNVSSILYKLKPYLSSVPSIQQDTNSMEGGA